MKTRPYFIGATVIVMVLLLPWHAKSHSPYQPTVTFSHGDFPDRPIAEFAKGRIGIVQPTWERGYLLVAYRYLAGKPLSREEQRSFLAHEELHSPTALHPLPGNWWNVSYRENNPAQQWVRARSKFRKEKPLSAENDWWQYTNGEDCLPDSFRTAIRTLRDRAKRYGSNSPLLQDWIAAQDQVYQNCPREYGTRSTKGVIPAELPNSAPVLARADRAYQIAAAHFYAGDAEEAIREFETIGRDGNSPWHEMGAYIAARMVLREAAPDDSFPSFNPRLLAEAERRLQAVAHETTSNSLKKDVAGLLQFIALRLHPRDQLVMLGRRTAQGDTYHDFGQDVIDLGFLIDHEVGTVPDFPNVDEWSKEYTSKLSDWQNKRYLEIREARTSTDLTDWLLTVDWDTPSAAKHAMQRWEETRSLPWLVAALLTANAKDGSISRLIQAAKEIAPTSPAYATANYYCAKLLRDRGNDAAARRVLDEALRHAANWPTSAVNLLSGERLLVAESLDDFVRLLPRQPIGFDNGAITNGESEYCSSESGYSYSSSASCEKELFEAGTPKHLLPQFDFDSAMVLNKGLPLKTLVAIAHMESLPENLRKQLAPAVWARALMLDRQETAGLMADTVIAARPELKPFVAQYQTAKTKEERKFLAAYAIAHFPGLRPGVNNSSPRVTRFDYADNYRDNWWCKDGLPMEYQLWPEHESKTLSVPRVSLVSKGEYSRAAAEFSEIVALGASGDWLSNTLIDWAKSHPDDERSPEALHFAMRAMRFSCDGSTKRSREVYLLLRRRYPGSPWAQKTRYWY